MGCFAAIVLMSSCTADSVGDTNKGNSTNLKQPVNGNNVSAIDDTNPPKL